MLKKPRILVAGSFVMDLIASTRRAPQSGQTVVGLSFRTAPGGKGANQAVQCARLGADVTMIGCVGDDLFGRELLTVAGSDGVDVSHVKVDPTVCTGVGHVLLEVTEHGAQNRITVIPGANFAITPADVAWLESEIGSYDMVLLQLELTMEVTTRIAAWAHAAGVPVMLNPAPAVPLPDGLLPHVTFLTPNEQEAAAMTGLPLRMEEAGVNEEDMKQTAAALREKGVENIIITLGGHGSAVVEPEGARYVPCVRMPHVADPTAAGDSFVGAFCTGLTAGLTQEQALTFASHAAAITVSRMGAIPSLPTLEEVRALLTERDCRSFDLRELDALN